MTGAELRKGQVAALSADLRRAPDPLALYAALSSEGTRPQTMLFETADRAVILEQAALEAVSKDGAVELKALTANGLQVLRFIEAQLGGRCARSSERCLHLRFGPPSSHDPVARLSEPSPFDVLRALLFSQSSVSAREPFALTLAGILAFDFAGFLEDLPGGQEDPLGFPDFIFWLAESLIVIEKKKARILSIAFGSDKPDCSRRSFEQARQRLEALVERCSALEPSFAPPGASGAETPRRAAEDLDDEAFAALVGTLKGHIRAGDIYQIVPSRTFTLPCERPLQAFCRQRLADPSPYMFYAASGDHILFGASPESAVRLNRTPAPTIEVKPIAGTRRRGASADEDDRLEADLRFDEKELAEHMMLVDLARNDVAQVSLPRTRRMSELLRVERYARVMHLVSRVEGQLRPEYDAFHALQVCCNVGTLSGAPKQRATELLRSFERTKRGPYGGAIGWISGAGAMDTSVVIRSAVIKEGVAYVRAGAGVVQDSDPLAEAQETRAKASAVLEALGSGS